MRVVVEEMARRMCRAWHRVDLKPGMTVPCGGHMRTAEGLAPLLDNPGLAGAGLAYALECRGTDVLELDDVLVVSRTRWNELMTVEAQMLDALGVAGSPEDA